MKMSKILNLLCVICLVAGVLIAPRAGGFYQYAVVHRDQVYDGWSKPLGSYGSDITFQISNGSDYVNVSISGPNYPPTNNVIIPPGQAYYYYNALQDIRLQR